MKKKLFRLYYLLFIPIAGVILLLTILFALMQTETFQGYFIHKIETEAKKQGIALKIEGFKGIAPFNWSLNRVEILWENGQQLTMDKVKLKIALLPLLQKKLSITFFTVNKMEILFSLPKNKTLIKELPFCTLPFHFSAKTLKIKELFIEDLTLQKNLTLSVSGKANINESLTEVSLDLLIEEPSFKNSVKIELLSSQKKGILNGKAQTALFQTKNLSSFFEIPLNTSLEASILCFGKWSFWNELQNRSLGEPLSITLEAKVDSLELENLSFINRAWALQSNVTLWPDLSSSFKNCSLDSNWIRFIGKLDLSSSFKPIAGSAIIALKDLSKLDSILPCPMSGEVTIKTAFNGKYFLFSGKSPSLGIGKEMFMPADFNIQSSLVQDIWEGALLCHLQNEYLPWKGSMNFSLKDHTLIAKDICLEGQKVKVSGMGSFEIEKKSWEGSFYILSEELKPFRLLFPASDLEGRVGGHFSLAGTKEDLSFSSNLLFKNLRYQSSLVDSLRIEAKMKNILTQPIGQFSFECENLFVKGGEITKLQFTSERASEGSQAFSLEAEGNWKQEFTLFSTGLWDKFGPNWSFACNTCHGSLFTKPFEIEPFLLKKDDHTIALEKLSLNIGEGTFFLDGSLHKDKAMMETKACRLPLDIFSLFYPNIALRGLASFQGSFISSKEETKGSFFATLEEIDFSKIKAKGSLQAHINPLTTQIHAHLYATEGQFLDWTATFPMLYHYEPFKVSLDHTKPVASELTTEGAIEEIFNFLQTANQKASGWVTSHLFFSGNLTTPSLQGQISLQNGAYENYISGTRLKNIEANITASGASLLLNELSAFDKEKGTVEATGELFLQRKGLFPFEVQADIQNLCMIQSDTLEAAATGRLTITGDRYEAKASGSLDIEKVTFVLSDNLLMEIPSIPVVYINKPLHLQRSEILPPSEYPMKLELNLSAKNTVFIKGKGLDSEWHGNILLKGTPLNPISKGSLTLQKGEFKFSGKTFTLLSGDLSFSDKPGQDSYLKITGQLQIQGTTIMANMQGPLTSPTLTFQSTPYLPTSSILALILFNKDISEISPLQTIQLAQVILSVSGKGGPDILEAIRKSIGIDRLTIAGKDGTDEIALQIGWYLSHGITVSLSQSATSSDVTVEVDLKNGFIFEAETQNQEEGKFSLKWNRNY